mgnify:CR=1 FL=1
MTKKRLLLLALSAVATAAWAATAKAPAAPAALTKPAVDQTVATLVAVNDDAPDVLIRTLSTDVLARIKADAAMQAGDMAKISALVDQTIMPYVNFQRMTASAVGRPWRTATPAQQKQIQDEFKTLLLRTYAGALSQVRNQTVDVKRLRAAPTDKEVTVKSELKSSGNSPVSLDYRLGKTAEGWRVYDMNVMGVWLIETYRADFASAVNAGGIDNLIAKLSERNRSNANTSANTAAKAKP